MNRRFHWKDREQLWGSYQRLEYSNSPESDKFLTLIYFFLALKVFQVCCHVKRTKSFWNFEFAKSNLKTWLLVLFEQVIYKGWKMCAKNKILSKMANFGQNFDLKHFRYCFAWIFWFWNLRFEFSWKAQNETDRIEQIVLASVNW